MALEQIGAMDVSLGGPWFVPGIGVGGCSELPGGSGSLPDWWRLGASHVDRPWGGAPGWAGACILQAPVPPCSLTLGPLVAALVWVADVGLPGGWIPPDLCLFVCISMCV